MGERRGKGKGKGKEREKEKEKERKRKGKGKGGGEEGGGVGRGYGMMNRRGMGDVREGKSRIVVIQQTSSYHKHTFLGTRHS